MNISDFLSQADTLINFRASDKGQLLRELSQRAAVFLGIPADSIASALLKREQLGSTGVGSGVAIPHARLPELRKPYAILVRLRKPIEFDAVDGQAVDIVFLLLLPNEGGQLNALAAVARKLRDQSAVQGLRRASKSDELYAIMVR